MTPEHSDDPLDNDGVPPGRTTTVEDYVPPPLGTPIERPRPFLTAITARSVLAARLSAPGDAEDSEFYGAAVHFIARLVRDFGGRPGALGLPETSVANSFTVRFSTRQSTEQALDGPTSEEMKGAQLFSRALSSRSLDDLLRVVRPDDDAVTALEHLTKMLFEKGATLDLDVPRIEPIRVTPDRAAALYQALRKPQTLPSETVIAHARLVGAYFDTHHFKLRLSEAHEGKRVFEGKYEPDLSAAVEQFVNREVVARVRIEREQRGAHAPKSTYTLFSLQAPATLA